MLHHLVVSYGINMKETVINDQLVKYDVLGQGDTALVFLHGWRSESAVWPGVVKDLDEKKYRNYLIDLPGFGQSPSPKTPFSIEDYAMLVYNFAKKQGIESAIIIGHSFGGRIGIVLAAKHKDLVKKLVLVDSAGIKKEYPGRDKIAKVVKPLFKPKFMHGLRRKIYNKMGAEDYLATPMMTETYLKVLHQDLTPELPKITQPTLLIWGANDTSTPISDAKIMQEKINNSKLEVLENAGHFSFLDQPEKFIKIFEKFIL